MRILLVDDKAMIRETFGGILRDKGHEVVEAIDGTDGLYKYQQGQFDLVISDINMPIQDGVWMVGKIRSANQGVDIVGFSGTLIGEDVQAMYEAGAEKVYRKDAFNDLCEERGL